jgi:hypothetical protein
MLRVTSGAQAASATAAAKRRQTSHEERSSMNAIGSVAAGLSTPASPTPAQVRKEADKGRDEATESNATKASEVAQTHKVNVQA